MACVSKKLKACLFVEPHLSFSSSSTYTSAPLFTYLSPSHVADSPDKNEEQSHNRYYAYNAARDKRGKESILGNTVDSAQAWSVGATPARRLRGNGRVDKAERNGTFHAPPDMVAVPHPALSSTSHNTSCKGWPPDSQRGRSPSASPTVSLLQKAGVALGPSARGFVRPSPAASPALGQRNLTHQQIQRIERGSSHKPLKSAGRGAVHQGIDPSVSPALGQRFITLPAQGIKNVITHQPASPALNCRRAMHQPVGNMNHSARGIINDSGEANNPSASLTQCRTGFAHQQSSSYNQNRGSGRRNHSKKSTTKNKAEQSGIGGYESFSSSTEDEASNTRRQRERSRRRQSAHVGAFFFIPSRHPDLSKFLHLHHCTHLSHPSILTTQMCTFFCISARPRECTNSYTRTCHAMCAQYMHMLSYIYTASS